VVVDSFPRQYARTQRFTIGEPRNLSVTADGNTVLMLRSMSGTDPVNCLWSVDAADGTETLLVDPRALVAHDADLEQLPAAERIRRERLREGASGITGYAADASGRVVAFAVGGLLGVVNIDTAVAEILDVPGPVVDPRPDPTGQRIAYVRERAVWVVSVPAQMRSDERPHHAPEARSVVAEPGDPPEVSWGSADFIAAEEMGRLRGFWWSPDGQCLVAARVDDSAVQTWYLSDTSRPEQPPIPIRYPAAGSPNAETSLFMVGLDGSLTEIEWDRQHRPYLCAVHWSGAGLILAVQSRDQRTLDIIDVDPDTAQTSLRWRDEDPDWVELVPGTPALTDNGGLLSCADRDGARRLMLDGVPITPRDLQVRALIGTVSTADGASAMIVSANPLTDATTVDLWRIEAGRPAQRLTAADGVHSGVVGGSTLVTRSATLASVQIQTAVHPAVLALERAGTRRELGGDAYPTILIEHRSETPIGRAAPRLLSVTDRNLASALLLPSDHDGRTRLPVLLDPYAGPHAQRVVRAYHAYLIPQWFADQGFAVIVTDGRGTPGRGSEFERAIAGDLASPVLEDQIDALDAIAADTGLLDLDRVAIRGWSFGGYLAALAALRRPDRFHAAIAGAPVTDWRLYDTHYTERYLGDPALDPAPYQRTNLIPIADQLHCPLLLIHGLADDNVVAANSLQLSSALLAAGRPHEVLMLAGVSHMTPQEVIAENLLLHQLEFLKRALSA